MLSCKEIQTLKSKVNQEFNRFLMNKDSKVFIKKDESPVTELDYNISNIFKNFFMKHKTLKLYNFYSEEDFTKLSNKNQITLDPVDGTKGLINGTWESAISLSIMKSSSISSENFSWIYNPFHGVEISSNTFFIKETFIEKRTNNLFGLISRSEYKNGLFSNEDVKNLKAIGSIAYKLALLSLNQADYVITKKEKSIWDIAAGSCLSAQRGFNLYSMNNNGKIKKITSLNKKNYSAPLIWCRENDLEKVLKRHKI